MKISQYEKPTAQRQEIIERCECDKSTMDTKRAWLIATSDFLAVILRPHYHGNLMISLQAWSTLAWIACYKQGFPFHRVLIEYIQEDLREAGCTVGACEIYLITVIRKPTRKAHNDMIQNDIYLMISNDEQRMLPTSKSSNSWSVPRILKISSTRPGNASVKVVRQHWKSKWRNFIFGLYCGCWWPNAPRCNVIPWPSRDQIRFASIYKTGI